MAINNMYKITANVKNKIYGQLPQVTANDSVVFNVEVYDDATLFELSPNYVYMLVSKKRSGKSVIREGSLVDGLIRFELGSSEMTEPGKVEATVQILDETNKRVSTARFDYVVSPDISMQGSLPTDDKTLVIANESTLLETIQKSENATQKAEAQKQRVDDLIAATPQPSEVVDARGGEVVLGNRLNKFDELLAQITLNVQNFGAKGDGVTDDTEAIRAAISALQPGQSLFFPKPTNYYKISCDGTDIFTIDKKNVSIYSDVINGVHLPIIKVEGTTAYPTASVFKLKESSISMSGISISCGTDALRIMGYGVSTDNVFRPSLSLESVHVLYPATMGISLVTYMTTFDRCQVRFCKNASKNGTGISVTGDPSQLEGTMLDMRGCFVDYSDKGYYFENMLYSGISACGADHIGERSYDLYRCKAMSFSGVGSEAQFKETLYMRACVGVTVTGLKLVEDPTKPTSTYSITLDGCTNCKVTGYQVGETGNFAQIKYGNGNVVEVPSIKRSAVAFYNNYGTERNPQHKIIPMVTYQTTETFTQDEFYATLQTGDSPAALDQRQIYQHLYLDEDYIIKLTLPTGYPYKTGSTKKVLKGVKGNGRLRIVGSNANKNLNQFDVGSDSSFQIVDNDAEIVFENITFYAHFGTPAMFVIKNSKVRFKNCAFRMLNANGSYKVTNLFNAENATIIIEQDSQLLDNPVGKYVTGLGNRVSFVNPSGSLPKFYQYENPNPTSPTDIMKTVTETGNNTKVRKNSTAYVVGDIALIGSGLYRCTVGGTTGATEPTESTNITDGSVTWTFISYSPMRNFVVGNTYNLDEYVILDGYGIFKITKGGTVDTINYPSTSLAVGSTATLSASGVIGMKGANSSIITA